MTHCGNNTNTRSRAWMHEWAILSNQQMD